jgi:hypothetical protein
MAMKRYKPEQIVMVLRQIEVDIANGKTTPQACKEARGIPENKSLIDCCYSARIFRILFASE